MNNKSRSLSNKTLVILAAVLLAAAAVSALILSLSRPSGAQVKVTVNGEVFGIYDLHEDQTVRIAPRDDSWHNTLTIRDGKASVTESDCANQICVHTPPLQEDLIGIIVCLPHGVAVELTE